MDGGVDRREAEAANAFPVTNDVLAGRRLVLLPRGESQPSSNTQISATEAMSAATATVGDMRQFCERQPEACVVGSQAAVALEDRAKAGAKRLYEMFNEKLSTDEGERVTTVTTARNAQAVPLPPARPSQRAPSTRRPECPSAPRKRRRRVHRIH